MKMTHFSLIKDYFNMFWIFLFVLLLFNYQQADCQESLSILLVDLLQFHNPTGLTTHGQCCDGSFPSGKFCPMSISCDLYTIVCLDFINSEFRANWTSCPLGKKSIHTKTNSTSLFNYHSKNFVPLQFDLSYINDNSIAIKIFVFYENTNMLLNRFYTQFRIDLPYSSPRNSAYQQLTLTDTSKSLSNINQIIIALKTYCRSTFYGRQCSVQCIPNDDCTSSYTCHPQTGEKICSSGWFGSDCSKHNMSATCLSSGLTCQNGGHCRPNSSYCCCPKGYTGSTCQYLSTCTSDKTCLHGGTCSSNYDISSRKYYFTCNCPHGYTGLFCQEKQDCPKTFYGQNCSVQCLAPNTCSQGHFYCNFNGEKRCLEGWGPINVCNQKLIAPIFDSDCPISTGCLNGGTCFNGSCCCPASYTGRLCELSIDPCKSNPCQNNALCLSTSTGYRCLCSSSIYTGSLCEINLNPCQYSPCQNGICQLRKNTSSFHCMCYPGYTGKFCQNKIDYCLSQPCQHNGICANVATGFVCTCLGNYTGSTCSNPCSDKSCLNKQLHPEQRICSNGFTKPPSCSEDINECLLEIEPCKNGGQCINTIGSFHCQCNDYYQGKDCSIPIDPCSSNPCIASNSISCTSVMAHQNSIHFNCTCRVGFTGNYCEIELNPCTNMTCVHGQCFAISPLVSQCVCQSGWTGIQCNEHINYCLSNPCLNAGKCRNDMNKYHCECLTGYRGDKCQIEMNLCSSHPCQNNGTCVNNVESFSCICPVGWTGSLCEVNINECSFPLSCHPNSTCIDLPGSYQCICPPWLTGVDCLTAIDQCQSYSCLNNGVCVNNYGSLPTCHCQAGFRGMHCEVNIDDCLAAPCYHNGTCIDQTNSFLCLCASGYTGVRCETLISQCNNLPCRNGGTCRDDHQDYQCLCPPYLTGKQCDQVLNPCLSFPCLHGSCTPTLPSYTCQCNSGYTGENCETILDQCAARPCGKHGNCTSLTSRFSCCCAPGYTGENCDQLIDVCLTNPCSIEGVERCVSNGISTFQCLCKPGYSGRHCEISINECLSQPCLHGGICIDFENSYQCMCPLTYTGVNCEILQDKCIGIQCLNGGECVNNGTNLTCICAKGFHGENCELIVDYCQSQPCLNGGICSNTESGAQCTCPSGIIGSFCETIIDQCESNPCENDGTCMSLIGKYVCVCSSGFMGNQCEIERNECEPVNPCLNSGRCVDRLNNFTCICNPGFTGYYCETQIDRCQSNPCVNGGICRTLINSFKCNCPPGYTGSTCSSMINYCSSNPCLNNGLCISLINDYRCICLDDYTGANCEQRSDECLSNPCLNNGTCLDGVWNYTCQCSSGFTGSNCQIEKNHCENSPCIKGLCVNKINGYECICPSSSYTGVHCEIQMNKCSSNPCLFGGTCIDGLDNFLCLCPPWYAGLTCEKSIDPCSNSITCANNGTCLKNKDIKPFGFTCQCLPGFTGQACEININDCVSYPCQYGKCIDQVNGFICQCYQGFDGVLCDNAMDQCVKSPCRNNGTCQSLRNTYQCHCPSNYQGKTCEEKIKRPCSTDFCLNNATCTMVSTTDFHCACLHGYTGRKCEVELNACDSNPCHTGTCQSLPNGFYSCSCSTDYQGYNCEMKQNVCDSFPCLNNGICSADSSNRFHCVCPKGFSGSQCQFGEYPCYSKPCLNNGTCIAKGSSYHCQCPSGLTGHRCEIDIDECATMPCLNNGFCLQSKLNSYECHCPSNYTGKHCETRVDPCVSKYCFHNGTCIRTGTTDAICSCLPGYTGSSCQNQINTCLSAPCLNGTCIPLMNSYRCNCFPGYTGQRCDQMINYCSSNPCFNNGTCFNQAVSFACQCPYGFQGRTCVIRVQSCQSSPCLNGGTCHDIAPGYHQCSCPKSYHGEFCQLRDSFCLEEPCQNNGVCLDTLNGYQCVCQAGYSGINCTIENQPCHSQPCLNNGSCRNTNNGLSYQCLCEKDYGGLQCELEINWCSSNPCQNRGTCISKLSSFVCLCPESYTGMICQTPINNCSLSTCKYGLPLVTGPTSCSCICSSGYTGSRCETPINLCLNETAYCKRGNCNYLGPGLANCTCPMGYSGVRCDTKMSNGACASCPCVYGQCRSIDELDDYVCDCYQGYTGKQCNSSIDLCKSSPCLYGQCVFDDQKGYRCNCLPGSTGVNCTDLIDTCSSNPCSNNGVCVQALNTYQCVCQSGYAGVHCEVLINQCTSLICLNNGTCINEPGKVPSARCLCPLSFTGIQCQYPYAPCASQPCQNLGTCLSNGPSRYRCHCPNGFTGKNCETSVHVCESRPCFNGGKCTEPAPYYYICQCSWPFYGSNCEFMFDPCVSNPCRGPLTECISNPIYQNYTCLCSSGFQGPTCSIPIDPCQSNPCQNQGSCVRTGVTTYSCACPVGYESNRCERRVNSCFNYPCLHGIAVQRSSLDCECQCKKSYYGRFCEINLCENNPCGIGECISYENQTYSCRCPTGFQFIMGVCSDINECRTTPGICGNGGRCLNTYGSYSCFCKTSFYGQNCEIFDPCRSKPCTNNGTCMYNETYPYWQCNCPALYTGTHCETALFSCSSNPCRTGTCEDLSNGDYQCLCPRTITGRHCDIPLLPCDSNPCLNNSTCLTLSLMNYTCVCPPRFEGFRCSERRTSCSKNPCQGNGTCRVDLSTGEDICHCPIGRYGTFCEKISACERNPCVHGICQNRNEKEFQCICDPGFTGKTCNAPYDACDNNPCMNGGKCSKSGNGRFICTCPSGFTGFDCSVPQCLKDSCFNGGFCSIKNNSQQCQCPCGFTGSRCEIPLNVCSLTTCQNNGTRLLNSSTCQCSCICSPTFTGSLCQVPMVPINRTYPGQIMIPVHRFGGSTWDNVIHCIDQVWNSLNVLLVCPTPYTLVNPTSFYPYCYRINQETSLKSQFEATEECEKQQTQLVWFQSLDELQEHLMPSLISHGLTRDFWTSGIYDSTSNKWQWLLSNNQTRINIDSFIEIQLESNPSDQSLYVSFNQSANQRLTPSSPSETFSTLCKISATRLLLNNQTRSIDLTSHQTSFINQSQVIIYNFNYTILPTIPLNTPIQQPIDSQYTTLCGAIGNPTTSVEPYTIDICGYFSSIIDSNVQLLMQTIASYYTTHRTSLEPYQAIPLNLEHYTTISGTIMTQISFIITSGSSTTLGSNIEPLPSINDMLNTIPYRKYQQCVPYISTSILLQLKLCIPLNEISSWMDLITRAISIAVDKEQSHVNIMLKGVQEGVTTAGHPANIAYFLITIDGLTYNQTMDHNLSILLSTIEKTNSKLLCSNRTEILLLENSIRDFYASCATPQILEKQLNTALHQAGIYTRHAVVFGVEEAVDHFGQIYYLPNIFFRYTNSTWLDSSLELNSQLIEIFNSIELKRLSTYIYRLSKSYSYFYDEDLTRNDREYLEKLILTLHNQQNSIISNNVKILFEDLYLNLTSKTTIRRIYSFLFYHDQQLDARYFPPLVLSSGQFNSLQDPLSYISNQLSMHVIKQRDLQQITYSGKLSSLSAERILKDYWQNPMKQGLSNIKISIIQQQEFLTDSSDEFFTTVVYTVTDSDRHAIPQACFNSALIEPVDTLCTTQKYVANTPKGYIPSFIDLIGNYTGDEEKFKTILALAFQRMGIQGQITSMVTEIRLGLDLSVITRFYYVIPNLVITQAEIQDELKFIFSTMANQRYVLYPFGQATIPLDKTLYHIANISLPISDSIRENLEKNLTLFNPILGKAKLIHAESVNTNQTRFYLTFINETQLISRCDVAFESPPIPSVSNENKFDRENLYLDRNDFISHSADIIDSLKQLWSNEIEIKDISQYVCTNGKRLVRVDYHVKNRSLSHLASVAKSMFENADHDCVSRQVRSIYLIEPRVSDQEIYQALSKAWQEYKVSLELDVDSSYRTDQNQTLTRIIYTINSETIPSVSNPIVLPNLYMSIPFKQYTIYIERLDLNSTILDIINQALRKSWTKGNSYLFQPNDLLIPSIHSTATENERTKVDYIIGLRSGDIGDYSPPTEKIYTEIFNKTGLETFVQIRYIPRSSSGVSFDNDRISLFPFDYRSRGALFGFDWWIILIIIIAILAIWLILCLICYACCRKRSKTRYNAKISKRPSRRIDVLAREQDPYLRPTVSSMAFDGPYDESVHSSSDDHQRISIRTTSPAPELQVRRLSEQDWPHFAMHNPYGLTSLLVDSPLYAPTSNRP